MRYTGPKNKLSRREGEDLGHKTTGSKSQGSLLKKLNIPPGQHGTRRRRKLSEHARQLREKQKLRYMFGLTEKQLKKYFTQASLTKGNTAIKLSAQIESRLDNVIYRLGFAPTRPAARQLINHGHVKVNGETVDIPSYIVNIDDTIEFGSNKTKEIPYIQQYMEQNDSVVPEWLEVKKDKGKLVSLPDESLIGKQINLRLVIEFYSR